MKIQQSKVIYDENGQFVSADGILGESLPQNLAEIGADLNITEPQLLSFNQNGVNLVAVVCAVCENGKKQFSLHFASFYKLISDSIPNMDKLFVNSISACRASMQNIAGISTRISDILDDAELYEEKEHLKNQIKNCYRLLRCTKNLEDAFNYSKDYTVNKIFYPKEIVLPLCKVVQMIIKDSDIQFTYDISEESVAICADPKKFENAFLNVLTNAFMYSGSEAKINVKLETSGDKVTLTISDNGYGMSAENLSRCAEMGYTGDNNSEKQGLGLYLAKRFTDSAKGSIIILSKENEGTKVVMTFPVASGEAVSLESNVIDYYSKLFSPAEVALSEIKYCNLLSVL